MPGASPRRRQASFPQPGRSARRGGEGRPEAGRVLSPFASAGTVGIPKERRVLSKPGEAEAALAAVEKACGGELPTSVFDATGNIHSMNGAFNYVAHGGKLVFVGHTKASLSVDNPLFHSREMTVMPQPQPQPQLRPQL